MPFLLKKKILIYFLFLALCSLFLVVPVSAADTPSPEQNPMCWTLEACKTQWTSQFGSASDFAKGKYWDSPGPGGVCESLGVCIPAGQASLEIKLPTLKTTTAGLGDYIRAIYIFLISIGGVVAAVLIIKGGFEWVTSAGSPERVKSAQSTIGSALMGLLLLLGSYTLLYTINPDLVRLRLPGVYMIRKIVMGATWCKDLPTGTKIAYAGGYKFDSQIPPEAFKIDNNPILGDPKENKNLIAQGKVPACSLPYFWKDSNDQTCQGHICELKDQFPQTCIQEGQHFKCQPGILSGTITASGGIAYPFIDNNLKLVAFCSDFALGKVSEIIIDVEELQPEASQKYVFNFSAGFFSATCLKDPNIGGFYLVADVNDKLGSDDWYAIGREDGKCNVNLFKKAELPQNLWYDNPALFKSKIDKIKNYLIPLKDLQAGLICDINLTREEFPSL